jgi:hypothetical protein
MDAQPDLYADASETSTLVERRQKEKPKGVARVQMPNRSQLELRPSDLESLLPEGHRARIVWGYVERQDMTGLYAGIKVVEGGVGAPPLRRRSCSRCGCMPPSKGLAVPAGLPV